MPTILPSALPPVLLAALAVAACSGDGPTQPPPDGTAGSLVVAPAALLLPAAGNQQQLTAYLVDASGNRTAVNANFTSSNPAVAAVTAGGLATGGTSIGSAQIVAKSGGLTSEPVVALRATPGAGALLVADSQVVSDPEPVDTLAQFGLGWQERVELRGASGSPGQLIIATGGAPVGGRIVAVEPGANGTSRVTYELVPLPVLFQELRIQERIPLTARASVSPRRASLDRGRTGSSLAASSGGAAAIEREFDAGPFECKAEVPPNIATVPFSLSDYTADPHADLTMELEYDAATGGLVAVATGTLGADLSGKPRLTLGVEAKVECEWELISLPVPIGGALSRFFGFVVPIGLGFELGGAVSEDGVGVDFTSHPSVQVQLGVRCAGACTPVLDVTGQAPGSLKPVVPALSDAGEIKLEASGFLYANLVFGAHLRFLGGGGFGYRRLEGKLIEAKAGLKQEATLASERAQAADPASASEIALSGFAEAGISSDIDAFAGLLQITIPALKKEWEFGPTAHSPQGTFTITPASVTPGDGTQLGQRATFNVNLTGVTYLGAYAVDGIEIRWLRTNGTTTTLQSGRPGCTDLEAAQDQVTFTCQTDFLEADVGPQTFYAFVKTRILGVPIPVPLEIAADGKATVTVGNGPAAGSVALDGASAAVEASTRSPDGTVVLCADGDTVRSATQSYQTRSVSCGADAQAQTSATIVASGSRITITGSGHAALSSGGSSLPRGSVGQGVAFTVSGTAPVPLHLTGSLTTTGSDGMAVFVGFTLVSNVTGDRLAEGYVASAPSTGLPQSLSPNVSVMLVPGNYHLDVTASGGWPNEHNAGAAPPSSGTYSITLDVGQ